MIYTPTATAHLLGDEEVERPELEDPEGLEERDEPEPDEPDELEPRLRDRAPIDRVFLQLLHVYVSSPCAQNSNIPDVVKLVTLNSVHHWLNRINQLCPPIACY